MVLCFCFLFCSFICLFLVLLLLLLLLIVCFGFVVVVVDCLFALFFVYLQNGADSILSYRKRLYPHTVPINDGVRVRAN